MSVPRMIAVDFDGTIAEFQYPGIGSLKPGVREALTQLKNLGFHIHIYSCRSCKWYPEIFLSPGEDVNDLQNRKVFREMREYLDMHQIPYDSIDDGSLGKPVCDYYIDDKGIRFEDNWKEIAAAITARESRQSK